MSTATSPKPVHRSVPPEERFWKRYSPNSELPLSGVSSLALHALLLGLLLLAAWAAYLFGLDAPPRPVPQEVVKLAERPGGSGGKPKGKAGSDGRDPQPRERDDGNRKDAEADEPPPRPPVFDPKKILGQLPPELSDNPLVQARARQGASLDSLRDAQTEADSKLRGALRRPAAKGQDGPGKDGNKGAGKDKGDGDREGPNKDRQGIPIRLERALRWHMTFNTRRPGEYLTQLRALGAILAIPTADGRDYVVVFHPEGKTVKDVRELNRVYWKDYDPHSVAEIMRSLGRKDRPSHFVALLPHRLEDQLADLERKEAEKHGKAEDQIFETRFVVVHQGTQYVPRLTEQRYLKPGGR
jgi:hypothetical protein